MKKKEVITRYRALVKELVEPAHNVVLSAGAAMVMMGLREETSDLDVDVLSGVFSWIFTIKAMDATAKGSTLLLIDSDTTPHFNFDDHVSLQKMDEHIGRVCVEGVWVYSPNELLKQKRQLAKLANRSPEKVEQDLLDIKHLVEMGATTRFTSRVI